MARRGRGRVRTKVAGVVWETPPDMLADDLDKWMADLEARLFREVTRAGQDMLNYAIANHPWVNRTGQAEDGLHIKVYQKGATIQVDIAHGAPHGIFLEKRWGGKWGVIPMTISYGAPRVRAAMDSVLRG